MIKLMTLRCRDYPGLSGWALNAITCKLFKINFKNIYLFNLATLELSCSTKDLFVFSLGMEDSL